MRETTAHPDARNARAARSAMSGWTLALLLATALASLPASSEGVRAGERAARALRTMQAEAYSIAGLELVAIATMARRESPMWDDRSAESLRAQGLHFASSRFAADVDAGLWNLPPPTRA